MPCADTNTRHTGPGSAVRVLSIDCQQLVGQLPQRLARWLLLSAEFLQVQGAAIWGGLQAQFLWDRVLGRRQSRELRRGQTRSCLDSAAPPPCPLCCEM